MFWFILILALLGSAVLIVMVLLQPSKGGGMTGAFGSLGSSLGSTFGSRRTLDFLAKGTAWTAGIIAVLSLIANLLFLPHPEQGAVNVKSTIDPGVPPAQLPTQTPTPGAVQTPNTVQQNAVQTPQPMQQKSVQTTQTPAGQPATPPAGK